MSFFRRSARRVRQYLPYREMVTHKENVGSTLPECDELVAQSDVLDRRIRCCGSSAILGQRQPARKQEHSVAPVLRTCYADAIRIILHDDCSAAVILQPVFGVPNDRIAAVILRQIPIKVIDEADKLIRACRR